MKLEKKLGLATRDAYGYALTELGAENPNLLVLDGDLAKSTKTDIFRKKFPERFFNVGIAEANLVGIAAGLASSGKLPFISSFACFMMCKGYDQLRMSVAFPELNVKVVSSHGGISVGEDGASQQSIEDFALATSLPNFEVLVPCDEVSTKVLVKKMAASKNPGFMRTCRPKAPVIYKEGTDFEIGKGVVIRKGEDVTIFSIGLLVFEALVAAESLAEKGIEATVVDLHTIKPMDRELATRLAKETGAAVVCEEHSIYGGLSAAVAQTLAETSPVPTEFVAIQDTFAESGAPMELLEHYKLTAPYIATAAERAVKRKQS